MRATTNAEKLRYINVDFFFVEQILTFASSTTNLIRKVKKRIMHGKNTHIIYHYEVNFDDAIKMSVDFGS